MLKKIVECTRKTVDVYSCGVYNAILELDLVTSLDKVTKDCQRHCIKQPQTPFHTEWPMNPNLFVPYMIIGMMRNVVIHGDACNVVMWHV